MTFRVGDRVAHPLHGAGVIDSIVSRKINGKDREYYVLKIPAGDMLVMIPVETSESIGVRPIIGSEEADRILEGIPAIEISMTQNWNKRYRENMMRLRSGNLMEVAEIGRASCRERV